MEQNTELEKNTISEESKYESLTGQLLEEDGGQRDGKNGCCIKKRLSATLPFLFFAISVFFFFTFCTYKCSSDTTKKDRSEIVAKPQVETHKTTDNKSISGNVSGETKEEEINVSDKNPSLNEEAEVVLSYVRGVDLMMKQGKDGQMNTNVLAVLFFFIPIFGMIITGTRRGQNGKLILYSIVGLLIVCTAILTVYTATYLSEGGQAFIKTTAFSTVINKFDARLYFLFLYWIFAVLFGKVLEDKWRIKAGILLGILGVVLSVAMGYIIKKEIDATEIEQGVYVVFNFGFYAIVGGFITATAVGLAGMKCRNKRENADQTDEISAEP